MSTITNNKLTDETLKAWKTEAMISLGETPKDCRDYSHHEAILALVTELQELRAAMLQSSQPVSNHDELPYAQVKAVADLYALCWQSGEVVTYTPDPEKATIWLNNYSGTCVQEYVKLERLQEALAGNSPVIPDGWVMVPKVVTAEIGNAINEVGQRCTCGNCSQRLWDLLLAAAPKPQNAPQNIPENIPAGKSTVTPDGWISCSERMPEDEQEVIVQNKLGYRYVSYFDEHSGLFFDMRGGNQINCIEHIFVTHWMPLPAAPQQGTTNL